jgi:hypothetical protein
MPTHGDHTEREDIAVLGEWAVLVHCPAGLADDLADTIALEIERELELMAKRLTALLNRRYRKTLDVRLDR